MPTQRVKYPWPVLDKERAHIYEFGQNLSVRS